jgi:alginate O-acetyltransferase complex protein AlgI
VAWVFFRAASVSDGVTILKKIAVDVTTTRPIFLYKQAAIWIVLLLAVEWVQRHHANPLHIDRFPQPLRWSLYYAVGVAIFLFAPIHYTPFIYFQF